MSVTVKTERLILREYTEEDFENLCPILTDAENMKFYPHTFDAEKTRLWIKRNIERYENFGFGLWAVTLKETGEFLGDCGISMQRSDGVILPEIAYHIGRSHQGRGYATEAAKACLDWIFRNTPFGRVYANINEKNVKSLNVARRIGMELCRENVQNGEKMLLFVKKR